MSEQKELGKILKEIREKKDVSLKEVSNETKISLSVLENLENGVFSKLPSYTHAIGFLKLYAKYLGLDYEELKDIFDREYRGMLYKEDEAKEALSEVIENVKGVNKNKNYIIISLIAILIVVGLIYLTIYLKSHYIPYKRVNKAINVENVTSNIENENVTASESDIEDTENADNHSVLSTLDLAKQLKESETVERVELKSVTLEFSDTCWVHINIDGKHEMDFIAEAGVNKIIEFLNFFEIDIGNASAIKIKYKDQTFTGLGGWRQPIKKLYFSLDDSGKLVFTKK
jgi:cytoskeletal protein RodZ